MTSSGYTYRPEKKEWREGTGKAKDTEQARNVGMKGSIVKSQKAHTV